MAIAMKTYNCPECGAKISVKDIDVKADAHCCRKCGKRSSLQLYWQREEAAREPGLPPEGVKVEHLGGVDCESSTRITYRHIPWWLALFSLLLFAASTWGFVSKVRAAIRTMGVPAVGPVDIHSALVGDCWIIAPVMLVMLVLVIFVLFGKTELYIEKGRVRYRWGVGPASMNWQLVLNSDTLVKIERRIIKTTKGGSQQVEEIVVGNGRLLGEERFGSHMSPEARRYFAHHLIRAAGELP